MADRIDPADEAGVIEAVRQAVAKRTPLAVEGRGSKRAMLRPVQAGRTLSTGGLTGITLYRPEEMVLSARAGTPVAEIEAELARHNQVIPAEPPDLAALFGHAIPSTIGGMVATNLSGPRRIGPGGALRDQLLGIRMVTGHAELVRSGGRVHKNVTGLDLCKLLAGSHGTLGVLTEVTLKLAPRPEAGLTVALPVPGLAQGVAALSAGLGSPYGVSGAALLPAGWRGSGGPLAVLRLEDFARFLPRRAEALRGLLSSFGAAGLIEGDESAALWRDLRDAAPLAAAPDQAIWRISVRPSAAPDLCGRLDQAFEARLLLDWGGGLVWAAGPATAAAHQAVMAATAAAGGVFTLFRAPDPLRVAVPVLPQEAPALRGIADRVKAALDPAAVLNPGRMR
ncbi:FAD-binding protein [Teichococcus vastitatis]|uniref:FAD-binding protein n=1 Tax=Teichococcus vastitatis TaxID=2307076 RepID=A0ABS9W5H2_9PROT|nr:FAD-binding protein [Pseudoroseomonas vastitatis]MCI0754529.1 FAD-binding protein [Pseudoroseomonas vastitatis]